MKLIIANGPNKGNVFAVPDEPCMIGRSHSNRVVLYDRRVSARHAIIEPTPQGAEIRDVGSSNGTWVNGRQAATSPLEPGDIIRLGDTELAFEQLPATEEHKTSFVVLQDGGESPTSIRAKVTRKDSTVFVKAPADAADVEALREDRRKLLALYRVNSAINSVRDTRDLLSQVLGEIFDVLNADRGFILLLDEGSGELVPAAMRRRHPREDGEQLTISRTIAHQVLERGEAVLSADAAVDKRFAGSDSVVAYGTRSAMCAPLHGRDKTHGIVYLDTADDSRAFSASDLPLLTAMANQLGIAIENASLTEARLGDERFAAIGQAIAGLSHYIKNILGSMQGGAHIVQRSIEGGNLESLRRGWDIVRRNERKIAELVLDMLNYSGASEPLLEPTQANAIVQEVADAVGAEGKEDIRAECDLAPDLPMASLDRAAIHRCILNLLSNAIDALPEAGGVIRFATRHDPDERAIRISVTDNGCGIDAALLPTIFDIFVSTKGARGTGLGLAVVKKLVGEHGGRVEVASEAGKGSTFTLVLPLRPPASVLRTVKL